MGGVGEFVGLVCGHNNRKAPFATCSLRSAHTQGQAWVQQAPGRRLGVGLPWPLMSAGHRSEGVGV